MLYQQGLHERLTKKATKGYEFRASLNHYETEIQAIFRRILIRNQFSL